MNACFLGEGVGWVGVGWSEGMDGLGGGREGGRWCHWKARRGQGARGRAHQDKQSSKSVASSKHMLLRLHAALPTTQKGSLCHTR